MLVKEYLILLPYEYRESLFFDDREVQTVLQNRLQALFFPSPTNHAEESNRLLKKVTFVKRFSFQNVLYK